MEYLSLFIKVWIVSRGYELGIFESAQPGPELYSTRLNFTRHALKAVVDNVYMTATP